MSDTDGTFKLGEEEKILEILEDRNERFGWIFKEENNLIFKQILDEIFEEDAIKEILINKHNSDENIEAIFNEILNKVLGQILTQTQNSLKNQHKYRAKMF